MSYVPPPRDLRGFPNARRAKPKTPFGGGGLRARWKEPDGTIYEWDYLHGLIERYDHRGNHVGEYDADTGLQVSGPDRSKRVAP